MPKSPYLHREFKKENTSCKKLNSLYVYVYTCTYAYTLNANTKCVIFFSI